MRFDRYGSVFLLAATALLACGTDKGTTGDGGAADAQTGGNSQVRVIIKGISIPNDIKLCAQRLTASSSSTAAGFSWTAVPEATQYAVKAEKAPDGATTTSVLFEDLQTAVSYSFPERVSKRTYTIQVYALKDKTPLCQLDGVNGITAS